MNDLRSALRRAVSALALAGAVLLLTPQAASACTVGIGYKPSLDIRDLRHPKTCSTGTSLGGAGAVAVLALGALAAAGWVAYRRVEQGFGTPPEGGKSGPSPALSGYLDAAGVTSSAPGPGRNEP
ncbi:MULTISPECIES: hypothetical protein [unclassified Streptomyces]|uniref:hypothetical protein n=1 Tax=unclassified Streptomyces TaxID=2593676 RepID=UPI000373358D|nr:MULTISPECIES: hypothetical protein [unclassified Streptomyces]MYT32905.1 hypothetical protein [Streptomyces sp. SID8354]